MKSYLLTFIFLTILKICWTSVTPYLSNHPVALIHLPHYDSAILQSSRIGPNFAYSTLGGHAYEPFAPLVHNGLSHFDSAVPIHLPQPQYIYLQNPILTNVDAHYKPREDKPTELDNEKIDDDTITIESA